MLVCPSKFSGLIMREHDKLTEEAPTRRMKLARTHGDECVGSTAHLTQQYREETRFDAPLLHDQHSTADRSPQHSALAQPEAPQSHAHRSPAPLTNRVKRHWDVVDDLIEADGTRHRDKIAMIGSDSASSSDESPHPTDLLSTSSSVISDDSDGHVLDTPPTSFLVSPAKKPKRNDDLARQIREIRNGVPLAAAVSALDNSRNRVASCCPASATSAPHSISAILSYHSAHSHSDGQKKNKSPDSTTSTLSSASSSTRSLLSLSNAASVRSLSRRSSPDEDEPPSPNNDKNRHNGNDHYLDNHLSLLSLSHVHNIDKTSMCSVFGYLDVLLILAVRQTCHLWFAYSYDPLVWSVSSNLSLTNETQFRQINFATMSMIRELELHQCHRLNDSDLLSIVVCQSLILLDLSYCTDITDTAMTVVANITSLQILSVEGCTQLTDQSLTALSSLPLLHSLSLSFLPVTDAGIESLIRLHSLDFLQLCYCTKLTKKSLHSLSKLPHLVNLNVGHTELKDGDCEPLQCCTSLTALNCESCDLSDTGLSHLQSLPLSSLNLHEVHNFTDKTLAMLANISSLTSLYLSYNEHVTDSGMKSLERLSGSLTVLECPECESLTDAACLSISQCQLLTTLDLTGAVKITDTGIATLTQSLTKLRLLNIGQLVELTNQSLQSIAKLPELVSLELNSCNRLTSTGANYLVPLTTLRSLSVSDVTEWDDHAIDALVSLTSLDALCMSGTNITAAGLSRLLSLPHLKELNVYNCPQLTEANIQQVKQASEGRTAVNV